MSRRPAAAGGGRILPAAGLVLLLVGVVVVVAGVFSSRWLILAGLVPLPVAGWILQRATGQVPAA